MGLELQNDQASTSTVQLHSLMVVIVMQYKIINLMLMINNMLCTNVFIVGSGVDNVIAIIASTPPYV